MSPATTRRAQDVATRLAAARLQRQGIADPTSDTPSDVVSRLLAVQAQDHYGALWAVGLRMRDATEATVAHAIDDGRLVRTWPMRGTLHLLAAADVRWMLALTGARAAQASRGRIERQCGLDAATLQRCRKLLEKTLRDGPVTRIRLYEVLEKAGHATAQSRGLNLLGQLAQEALICGGPRDGKQATYAWLDAWVPASKPLPREEALAALATRYFASRGPATAQDLAWWSGLTLKDVQVAISGAKPQLASETVDGTLYWSTADAETPHRSAGKGVHLLPPFDEYLVAYKDRSFAFDPAFGRQVIGVNGLFNASLVSDGRVVATWKRLLKKDAANVSLTPLQPLRSSEMKASATAVRRYGAFLGVDASLG
ncbi:winged helix DNA-binding protein [Luteimonas cucumeris]|uniref:Winged helix DNA-binding protein n=1 Tax=Luteimonas cucumeris TaxID=985012 RepID=A0A562KUU2_9GAMM|nr:winged helix DNA-binding domain-containing protein [Luteimonas cucumeris]TWH99114.1 winged helix DNA-binding protein [Luteimonas cucumeris]